MLYCVTNYKRLLGCMDFAGNVRLWDESLFGFVKFLFDDKVVVVTKKLL